MSTTSEKTDKSVSKSVSLPESLWETVEKHAPGTPGRDRSGYIRNLVEEDLKKNGPLAEKVLALRELEDAAVEFGGVKEAIASLQEEARKRRGRKKAA